MIFLDSWIWLEFFQEDEKSAETEKIIESVEDNSAIISATVLMEVRYQIQRKYGRRKADRLTSLIRSFDNLEIMPVTEEVAVYAADLRNKYYERQKNAISYADSIHIAITEMTGCNKLYTGDPDFSDIEEVETEII
ncbi:MAG: VapC toxin family PIN domain ribonuclease [Nanohaloarchaea archaeon SW_7_43_1]|nr:MAG: VapC toxin family PIN domain ribonuclease [Nanohaloarchaea archaeon SW_7_43_1]